MTVQEFYESYFVKYPHISTDTRTITKGSIFIALKGENFDGNQYARKAIESGAVCAIVDDESMASESCFYVNDSLQFLQDLARYHRQQLNIPVIGITGTNGKTTTKELVSSVLSQKYKVEYTRGNLNNHIGVPLTLLSITKQVEIAVVEMGANHPGEIKTLVNIAMPTHGLITNVGKAHLLGFGSFENIIKTKTELYEFIASVNGTIFIDADNQNLTQNLRGVKNMVRYSFNSETDYKGKMLDNSIYAAFSFEHNGKTIDIHSSLYGEYNAKNMLTAATVGSYFGVTMEQIKTAIEGYVPSNNRSQTKKTAKNTLIMDAYNANPTSMRASLETFISMDAENKCVILGEMFELGEASENEHLSILKLLQNSSIPSINLVGKWPRVDWLSANYYATSEDLKLYLKEKPIEHSTVLIKGSRGVKLEVVVDVL
ncbi:MAG: UDP-N-acetylmuramoyl-tripeptide--D-alanyl-D-alanine ligase [Bacteroidales bacterium]|nr:UDP-N-acetylmuramoyl-tripeptide--D-alanyl-D-alanine ligase [Bacteroidales bacterium]